MSSPRPLDFFSRQISIPTAQFPNSNGITSFADPHLLNPFLPYRYKNHRGRGPILQAKTFFLGRRFARSLFSRSYKLQISQLLSFAIHANWWGGTPPSSMFRCASCVPGRSDLHTLPITVSPLDATLATIPISVHSKVLTGKLTPLNATLTNNRGEGGIPKRSIFLGEEGGADGF
jgi:hypothetical protein